MDIFTKLLELKKRWHTWDETTKTHPDRHICYSNIWTVGDDIAADARREFDKWFFGKGK